jgi:hypothetical protein
MKLKHEIETIENGFYNKIIGEDLLDEGSLYNEEEECGYNYEGELSSYEDDQGGTLYVA